MPSDQEFIEISQLMEDMQKNYLAARDTMTNTSTDTSTVEDDSDIPF